MLNLALVPPEKAEIENNSFSLLLAFLDFFGDG
jgi:hypothetical protein